MPTLVYVGETGARAHVFGLEDTPVVVGRHRDAAVQLDSSGVSRVHAEVLSRDGGQTWVIRDLKSANGTYLNGEPILEARLADGDRIRCGQTEIEFRLGVDSGSHARVPTRRSRDTDVIEVDGLQELEANVTPLPERPHKPVGRSTVEMDDGLELALARRLARLERRIRLVEESVELIRQSVDAAGGKTLERSLTPPRGRRAIEELEALDVAQLGEEVAELVRSLGDLDRRQQAVLGELLARLTRNP